MEGEKTAVAPKTTTEKRGSHRDHPRKKEMKQQHAHARYETQAAAAQRKARLQGYVDDGAHDVRRAHRDAAAKGRQRVHAGG